MFDVIVMGSGPAGLALLGALADEGLHAAGVAPSWSEPWLNNFAVWQHELDGTGLDGCLGDRWPSVEFRLGDRGARILPAGYGRFDNDRLKETLIARVLRRKAEIIEGAVCGIDHERTASSLEVTTSSGRRVLLRAKMVVDATGHATPFIERPRPHYSAAQVAYGYGIELPPGQNCLDPERALLMDFSSSAVEQDRDPTRPSFLYALPLSDGRLFVEETSLVGKPPLDIGVLEARLQARLRAMGLGAMGLGPGLGAGPDAIDPRVRVERCFIPMDVSMPKRPQRIVGFGAAASMVHPATGYQVGRVLREAPRVAAALAQALQADSIAEERSRHAWSAVWPSDRARAWSLYRLGMEVLAGFDPDQIRAFFDAFLRLPLPRLLAYLDGTARPREILGTMLDVARAADPRTRRTLVARSASALLRG